MTASRAHREVRAQVRRAKAPAAKGLATQHATNPEAERARRDGERLMEQGLTRRRTFRVRRT